MGKTAQGRAIVPLAGGVGAGAVLHAFVAPIALNALASFTGVPLPRRSVRQEADVVEVLAAPAVEPLARRLVGEPAVVAADVWRASVCPAPPPCEPAAAGCPVLRTAEACALCLQGAAELGEGSWGTTVSAAAGGAGASALFWAFSTVWQVASCCGCLRRASRAPPRFPRAP